MRRRGIVPGTRAGAANPSSCRGRGTVPLSALAKFLACLQKQQNLEGLYDNGRPLGRPLILHHTCALTASVCLTTQEGGDFELIVVELVIPRRHATMDVEALRGTRGRALGVLGNRLA